VPVLKTVSHLPIIVDPSHVAGVRCLVPALARAATVVGADGLLVEVHPQPRRSVERWKSVADLLRVPRDAGAISLLAVCLPIVFLPIVPLPTIGLARAAAEVSAAADSTAFLYTVPRVTNRWPG
jgi:hypothetical protein